MALLHVNDLTFCYEGEASPVFENVNLDLDTRWRLGLVGRNGRGKTTFLRLLMGEYEYQGSIDSPEKFEYFPMVLQHTDAPALSVARGIIAPFDEWEAQMARLAASATDEAMEQYGELEQEYAQADGYVINEQIVAEASKLGIHPDVLENPFDKLSGGEQVKLMLVALFLKKHRFLLIDEPTDHLDAEGRRQVAQWLSGKSGYILVSHDRAFLDECVDHILSINRADIELQKGNYSSWRQNRAMRDNFELAEHQKLTADIGRLKDAAQRTEKWSDKIERSKKGNGAATYNHGPASVDRGYVGHKAARMMQRSKSIERRRGKQIEEKQSLLKNLEMVEPLRVHVLPNKQKRLVTAGDISLCFGRRCLFQDLSFTIDVGDRIAIKGPNGSGKSTFLKLVMEEMPPTMGKISVQPGLVISTIPQNLSFLAGSLQEFAEDKELDQSLFLAILRKLDFERDAFTRDMSVYSMGQKKKVCLAASLAKPAHLYVWDEPLNYVDILSREQIENALLEYAPTLLFVEHDAAFTDNVATRTLQL